MVLNLNRCSGCLTCEVACKMVNGTRTGVDYTTVERVEWGQFPDAHRRYKINICMHCENASCIAACPTKASYATDEGVVLVDYDKCIGCGACVTACPYGARTLVTDQPFAFGDDPLPCEEQQADLGNIVEIGNGLVAGVIALVCSLVTIAIAWIFYRPVLAIVLLLVAGAAIFLLWKKRQAKKSAVVA